MSHANDTATRPSLSFEFFPPKDDAGIDRLMSGRSAAWLNTIETLGFNASFAFEETNLPAATNTPSSQEIWLSNCTNAFPDNSS